MGEVCYQQTSPLCEIGDGGNHHLIYYSLPPPGKQEEVMTSEAEDAQERLSDTRKDES
jgi:hypothetical protein